MELEDFYLKNGIRVVLIQKQNVVSHAALTVMAGSRYELGIEEGLAHYIEHGLFKGTNKRKAFHVLSRLDSVGGELNAYTTKEEISVHASFMNAHLERALEILADVTFSSTFPTKEMEKEKDIIVDEIQSYKDSPVDSIFDDFEELVFQNHPLAHPILGTEATVRNFNGEMIQQYIQKNFVSEGISLVIIGEFKTNAAKKYLKKHFEDINFSNSNRQEEICSLDYQPFHKKEIDKSQFQTHTILGGPSYHYKSDKRLAMALLNNWLGGPALNSRLSLYVREKYGYTYNIESSYSPFIDTGLFAIYFGTDKKHADKTLKVIFKELKRIRENKLGINQLNMAKVQFKGNLALSQESNLNLAIGLGKSILVDESIESVEELHAQIDQVTATDLWEVANEMLDENKLSILTYVQEK